MKAEIVEGIVFRLTPIGEKPATVVLPFGGDVRQITIAVKWDRLLQTDLGG